MPYKKVFYTIKCPKCKKEYQVLPQAYIRKQKDPKYGNLCKSCRAKVQWEEMSEEQKQNMKITSSNANRKKYDSLSEKEKQALKEKRKEGVKQYWKNLTEEERKEIASKRSMDRIAFLNSRTEEQMSIIGQNISRGKLEAFAKLSQEELLQRKIIKQQERKQYWDSLSAEDRQKITTILRNNNKNTIQHMTDEERKKRSVFITNRNHEYWNTISDQEKEKRIETLKRNHKEWWDHLTDEEKLKIIQDKKKYWKDLPDDEKMALIRKSLANSQGINKFHQRFVDTFHHSILSESYDLVAEVVLSNHPIMHSWDYGIYDKEHHELKMVVDLDGAYFHADNCDYDGLHSKEEYDENRVKSIGDQSILHMIIQENQFGKCFQLLLKTILMNYEEYVADMFKICRYMPFPTPRYTDRELIKSYNSLVNMDCNDKYHQDISLNTRIGDRLINHFHASIYRANRKGEFSLYDAWQDDELLRKCIENRVIYQNYLNPNKILQGFNVSKIAPKVSVFSAGRAKLLIYKYINI